MNLTVETTSTQQSLVEHVNTVGGCQNDDSAIGAESVHFGQQGVQRILTLVVSTHCGILRTGAAYSVNLIDEDDTGRLLFCLAEQVAHTTGSHAHKHLHEVGTRHREERHTSLASNCFCQQRLTSSRRSHEQSALGNLTTQVGVFLRILQELHNLLHLLLGTSLSSHVLEGDSQIVSFLVHLRLRLADAEHTAASAASASHAVHDEEPEQDDEDEGSEADEEVPEAATLLVVVVEILQFSLLLLGCQVFLEFVNRAELYAHVRFAACLLQRLVEHVAYMLGRNEHLQRLVRSVHFHLVSVSFLHILLELGVGGLLFHGVTRG